MKRELINLKKEINKRDNKITELQKNLHDLLLIKNIIKLDRSICDAYYCYAFYDSELREINWAKINGKVRN